MITTLIVASLCLKTIPIAPSISESHLRAANLTKDTIDPKAKSVADAMRTTYAHLKTLQCTVVDRTWSTRVRFAFQRPGKILVQKLTPDKPTVDMELRLWGNKLVVSSPENKTRYLQTTIETHQTPLSASAAEARIGLDSLTGLLEGRPPYKSEWVTAMSLGDRLKADDGTLVEVLKVTIYTLLEPGNLSTSMSAHLTFQIGVADHLIRKDESKVRQGNNSYSTLTEYEDLAGNKPIPSEVFAFHPAQGTVSVDRIKATDKPDPKAESLIASATRALTEAKSLTFVDEWTERNVTLDDKNIVVPAMRNATVRFDLEHPFLAHGELTHKTRPNEDVLVVSDGTQVHSRQGNSTSFLTASVGKGYSISDYAGQSVQSEAWAARLLVRSFYVGTGPLTQTSGKFYRPISSRTIDGTVCQGLELSGETVDSHGIPAGLRWAYRVFFGQEDQMPRLYENERQVDMLGKVYTIGETDRITRIILNPSISPTRFALSEVGNVNSGVTRPVPILALVGDHPSSLPQRTLDGKAFSIASLKGKIVIIDAYMHSCAPCRVHMLQHRKLVEKYAKKGVTTIGLILDDESSRTIVEKFVATQKLTYPQLFDGKGWKGPAPRQFGIGSVPFMVVLGRDGKVAYVNPSETELERILATETKN